MKITYAIVLMIFFITLDFTATLSGMNTFQYWQNPDIASLIEYNPIARQIFQDGILFLVTTFVVYASFIILFYEKIKVPLYKEKTKWFSVKEVIFSIILTGHIFGWLSWLIPMVSIFITSFGSYWNFVIIRAFIAIPIGIFILMKKQLVMWLDTPVIEWKVRHELGRCFGALCNWVRDRALCGRSCRVKKIFPTTTQNKKVK